MIDTAPAPLDLTGGILHIAAQAQHELAIFSSALEPRRYGTVGLHDLLRSLALGHARNRVRILVRDPQRVLADGAHRLVELARLIPSRVSISAATAPADNLREEWVLADRAAFLLRPDAGDEAAVHRPDDPGRTVELLSRFNSYWAHGALSREFSALRL